MKISDRLIALALCFSLTLGAFVYRPPEAKALVGVDDAVVIGALLTAFAGGCGLIFSNNGMSSNEIAQGLTAKWNDYKETLASAPATFSAWLGYDSMDALITDLRWDEVKDVLSIPRAMARKFADFTDWLTNSLDISTGDQKPVLSSVRPRFYQFSYDSQLGYLIDHEIPCVPTSYVSGFSYTLGTPGFNIYDLPSTESDALVFGFSPYFSDYFKCYSADSKTFTVLYGRGNIRSNGYLGNL